MSKKMKTKEAVQLIKQGQSLEGIVISDMDQTKLGFRDAILLAENGYVVPVGNIVYDDSEIEYDPDFDEVVWSGKYGKLNDLLKSKDIVTEQGIENLQETITIEIEVKDISFQQWLERNTGKLQKLVNKLVVDLYHTDQILHSEDSKL